MKKCGSIALSLFHKKDSVTSTVYVFNLKTNVLHLQTDSEISTTN